MSAVATPGTSGLGLRIRDRERNRVAVDQGDGGRLAVGELHGEAEAKCGSG